MKNIEDLREQLEDALVDLLECGRSQALGERRCKAAERKAFRVQKKIKRLVERIAALTAPVS